MKESIICKHCGKTFSLHGNQIPWNMNRHYQNVHPVEYAEMERRTNELHEAKEALMREYPNAVCVSMI